MCQPSSLALASAISYSLSRSLSISLTSCLYVNERRKIMGTRVGRSVGRSVEERKGGRKFRAVLCHRSVASARSLLYQQLRVNTNANKGYMHCCSSSTTTTTTTVSSLSALLHKTVIVVVVVIIIIGPLVLVRSSALLFF